MNNQKERNFEELAEKERQFQESEEIKMRNHSLWMENQNLHRTIQKLQVSVLEAEKDKEVAHIFAQLLITRLPKGACRKEAQQILNSLTQKRQRRFPESMYIQTGQYDTAHHGVYGGYDECGGYGYGDHR